MSFFPLFTANLHLLVGKAALFSPESHNVAFDGSVNIAGKLGLVVGVNRLKEIADEGHVATAVT